MRPMLVRNILASVTTVLLGCTTAAPEGSPPDWLKHSEFVFDGTVIEAKEDESRPDAGGKDAVLVRVEAVYEKPAGVALEPGDQVWIARRSRSGPRPGSRTTWYATGWIFGSSILLRELGYESDPQLPERKAAEVRELRAAAEDDLLAARLRAAEEVLLGTVASVEPAPSKEPRFDSEHDPDWHVATFQVERSFKGPGSAKAVAVQFAASMDILWFQAPKLAVDQRVVLLLRKDPAGGSYLLTDPADVLSSDSADRIARLLAR